MCFRKMTSKVVRDWCEIRGSHETHTALVISYCVCNTFRRMKFIQLMRFAQRWEFVPRMIFPQHMEIRTVKFQLCMNLAGHCAPMSRFTQYLVELQVGIDLCVCIELVVGRRVMFGSCSGNTEISEATLASQSDLLLCLHICVLSCEFTGG